MSSSPVTVIDCGASSLAVGTFRVEGDNLRCEFLGTEVLSASAETRWVEAVIAALAVLAARCPAAGSVMLVLPPSAVLLKHLKTPRLAASRRDEIVKFEVAQNIPHAIDDVVWAAIVAGEQEQETDLLLAAAKLEVVEPLCRAAAEAGWMVQAVVPSALAVRALESLVPAGGAESRLVVVMGSRAATFLLIDGPRFAIRSLPMAGSASAPESADNGVLRLAQEAKRSILHFQRQNGLAAPACVRLGGESDCPPGLAARLETQLALPVTRIDAARAVDFALGIEPGVAGPALDNLVGAAALQLKFPPAGMNLLPPSISQRADLRRRGPWLIASAVLAVAALLPPLFYYRSAAAAARADLAAIDASLAPVRGRETRNRARLEEIAALARETQQLRSLAERRTSWIRLFADLQERFTAVEDVWLESLQTIAPARDVPMKLAISGRMLDRTSPLARGGPETGQRVRALLEGLVDSPFVAAVESERFDNSQPGILRFDFILVTDPAHPL